eukprot:4205485-Amphidinium_carterae.2
MKLCCAQLGAGLWNCMTKLLACFTASVTSDIASAIAPRMSQIYSNSGSSSKVDCRLPGKSSPLPTAMDTKTRIPSRIKSSQF